MNPAQPMSWPRQPDSRTCGPSVVVVAEELHRTGTLPDPWPDFAARVQATHRRINRLWPRALGTTPWAVRRALAAQEPRPRRIRRFRAAEVAAALPQPVPVYVGSRLLPRHVVLVLAARESELIAYDPARGGLIRLGSGRWTRPWWAIVPAPDRP